MKEYPDYKYRPRRKPKTLRKEGYPYSIPYPSVPMDAFRTGEYIFNKSISTNNTYLFNDNTSKSYTLKKKKLKLLFIFLMIIFQISSKLFQFLSRTSFIFISISYQMVRSPGNTNFQKFLFDLSSHYFIPILRDLSFDLSIY